MAFPFKSGIDLYNNEALRMRLHNLGADPTEVGAGLIYFNTSTGLNTSGKARIYTGSAWKTLAFAEDLDVASNADFIALQEKVGLLSGDVDTDAIISNMKEVSAFLAGFAEDASLMDLLNSKLSTSGGTIKSTGGIPLTIKRPGNEYPIIAYYGGNDELYGYIGVNSSRGPVFLQSDNTVRALLHSGNVGEYALKTDGSNAMKDVMTLEYANPRIAFKSDANTTLGSIGFYNGVPSAYLFSENAWKTIAFTDSNVASATKLQTARTIWGQSFDGTGDVDGTLRISSASVLEVFQDELLFGYGWRNKSSRISGSPIRFFVGDLAKMTINSSGNVTIGNSDEAGDAVKLFVAGRLQTSVALLFDSGYGVWKGDMFTGSLNDTDIVYNATKHVFYNGNVGIGTETPDEKLHVVGNLHVTGNIIADGEVSAGGDGEEGTDSGSGANIYATQIAKNTTSMTVTHNLGTRDVVVSIYERDATSTAEVWNMILTDIEITDANSIRVTFGSATTVVHKVVIFGASA